MFRSLVVSVFLLVPGIGNALAQDMPWQASVTGQIEALHQGEAETALGLAGSTFREIYKDPAQFLNDIKRSGYGPIVEARSHSFGKYQKTESGLVLQVVTLIGPDQSLYEAVYEMIEEPDLGWRVRGVILRKLPGLGV